MSDLISLSLTTVDAPDAIALARFYAEITGGVANGDEHWALATGPNGDFGFQQAGERRAACPDGRGWPGAHPCRIRLLLWPHVRRKEGLTGARLTAARPDGWAAG